MGIPGELLPLWNVLYNETVAVHAKWQTFKHLFVSGQNRLDHISNIAWQLFQVVELGIRHDVILALARLSDPERNRYQTNAALRRIIAVVKDLGADDLRGQLEIIADEFYNHSEKVRLWRNKLIAHNDESHLLGQYDYAIGKTGEPPLPPIQPAEIDKLLSILAKFMNSVEGFYTQTRRDDGTTSRTLTAYDMFIHRGGVESLISELKKAQRYDELVEGNKIEREYLWYQPGFDW